MKIMYNIHKRAVQWREQFIHNKRSDDRNCCIHTASSNATPSLREMIKLWLAVLYSFVVDETQAYFDISSNV